MKNNQAIYNILKTELRSDHISGFLKLIDKDFHPRLSSKVNIDNWAKKLYENAVTYVALDQTNSIVGLICFYCNDNVRKYGYITVLGVDAKYRSRGLSRLLLKSCFQNIKDHEYKTLGVKTWNNSVPYGIYASLGFVEKERIQDRPKGEYTVYLEKYFT